MTSNKELKLCPFCGGEAGISRFDAIHLTVECKNCKCRFVIHEFIDDVFLRLTAAWNRRVTE